ncbi:MAG: hypothetical protein QM733_06010 [Ilumatobacteraceae bacterium]
MTERGEPADDGDIRWLVVADEALAGTCAGWQRHRRCTDEHGRRLPDPHPACLHAQFVHDRTLLEHGLL